MVVARWLTATSPRTVLVLVVHRGKDLLRLKSVGVYPHDPSGRYQKDWDFAKFSSKPAFASYRTTTDRLDRRCDRIDGRLQHLAL